MANWDDQLNRVIQAVRALDGMPTRVLDAVEGDVYDLLQQGFDAGADPYGQPWAALQPSTIRKSRHPPPLTDTRAMRDSLMVRANGLQLECSIDDPFPYHQAGTGTMASRPPLPDDRGLPASWEKAINVAVLSGELADLLDAAE